MSEQSELEKMGDEFSAKLHENGFGELPQNEVTHALGQVLNVAGEAGEFVEAFRRYAGLARRSGTASEAQDELADVVISAYVLASSLGWPLDQIIREKADVIRERPWRETAPKDKVLRLKDVSGTFTGVFDPGSVSEAIAGPIKATGQHIKDRYSNTASIEYHFNAPFRTGPVQTPLLPTIPVPERMARIYNAKGGGYWFEMARDWFVHGRKNRSAAIEEWRKHSDSEGKGYGRSWYKLPELGNMVQVVGSDRRNLIG